MRGLAFAGSRPEILPAAEARNRFLGEGTRAACRGVDQHQLGEPGRGAGAVVENRLSDRERAAPELRDAGADLDVARPAQLAQEVDLGMHQHVGAPGHADAEIGPAEHGDAAGLEIGGEHRVVDVALRIEVGIADDVRRPVRVVVDTRGRPGGFGLVVQGDGLLRAWSPKAASGFWTRATLHHKTEPYRGSKGSSKSLPGMRKSLLGMACR